jgi:chromosome segregation ATPase
VFFPITGFLISTFLYCYFWKVSTTDDGVEDLKKKLAEAKEENVELKKVVAKNEEDLQVLKQHSAVMECEASDASKARDLAKAELARLFEEFKGLQAEHFTFQESNSALQAEHAKLQEDHSILKEELE